MGGDQFEVLRQLAARYWLVFTSGVAAILTVLKVFHDYTEDSLSVRTWIAVAAGAGVILLLRFPWVAIRLTRWILGMPPAPANPPQIFRGPLPYLEGETLPARQAEIDASWRLLQTQAFAVLEGESGCGKSSLLNSALLPRARERYRVIECRVADDPLGKLVSALTSNAYRKSDPAKTKEDLEAAVAAARASAGNGTPRPLLLCIDQFEELFVTVRDEVRRQVMSVLRDAVESRDLRLFLAIRSDFRDLLLSLCREVDGNQKAFDLGNYFSLEAFPERQALAALGEMLAPLHADEPLMKQQMAEFAHGLVHELLLPPRDRRLSQDDERTVLPVELQTVGMMIESVGVENFSGSGIQRLGGKAGLLRTYIEKAKEYVWRRSGVSGDRALLILRKLISPARTKWAQTASAIGAELGQSPSEVAAVLEAFASRYLVRHLPGEGGEIGALRYELMHEHLVRILIEAPQPILQRARDAEERLKFWLERAQSGSRRSPKWKSLFRQPLPVLEAIRLRPFATSPDERRLIRSSLYAFAPKAALILLILGTISWTVIRQKAERTGDQIVTRFNSLKGLQAEDDEAIWLLHGSGNFGKRKALEAFLSNDQNAQRFLTHAELILQSIAGVDPERAIAVARPVWQKECLAELRNLTEDKLGVCAWIENELPQANIDSWAKYLTAWRLPENLFVGLYSKLKPADQVKALALFKLAFKANRFSGNLAASLLERAPADMTAGETTEILVLLAKRGAGAWEGFNDSLGEGARSRELRELATVLINERIQARIEDLKGDELLQWAIGVAEARAAGWRMDTAAVEKAKGVLLAALRDHFKDPNQLYLLRHLGALQGALRTDEVELAKTFFLATYRECRGDDSWDLEGVLWFSEKLSDQEARQVFERLSEGQGVLTYMEGYSEKISRLYRQAVEKLAARLSLENRRSLEADFRRRLSAETGLRTAVPLLLTLGGLVPPESVQQERLTNELIRLARQDNPWPPALSTVARAWWPDLLPRSKERMERLLRDVFRRTITTGDVDYVDELADLLDDLNITFTVKESREQLERLLRRSVLPCDALAPLARPETVDLLVNRGLRYPFCPLGISPSIIEKLEKLEVLRVEEIGERVGGAPVPDRARMAAWARKNRYDVEGRFSFKGTND